MKDTRDDRSRRPLAPNLDFASDLVPSSLAWFWPHRIPLAALTLLVGDPGVGKSLLVADLAARASADIPWPDTPVQPPALAAWDYPEPAARPPADPAGPPRPIIDHVGGVVIVSHEDSRCAAILPRLIAAGANLARIPIVNGVYREPIIRTDVPAHMRIARRDPGSAPEAPLHLPEHLPILQQAIRDVSRPRLVILDTLHSLISPAAQSSPSLLASMLEGLAETARMYSVAIVATLHLTKASASRTLYRVRGSIPFVAAARSALLLTPDPLDPRRRILSTLKSIYAEPAAPIAFDIVPRLLDPPGFFERPEDGRPPTPREVELRRLYENPFLSPIPAIRWLDSRDTRPSSDALLPTDADPLPEELLDAKPASRSALLEARRWLADYLAAGPKPVAPLLRAARAHGHSAPTLRRAKRLLGVISHKLADDGPWVWSRPAANEPGSAS